MGFPLREEGCVKACEVGGRWIKYNESISLLPTSKFAPLSSERESHTRKY